MSASREERIRKSTDLHLAMEVKNVLQSLAGEPGDRPAGLQYFRDRLEQHYGGGLCFDSTLPVIGTMCVMVPDELILAVGARPLRLCCGAGACEQAGAEFLPAKACPLVKATLGLLQVHGAELSKKLRAIVIPATCDQKKKSAEMLKGMGYEVILLEMPPTSRSEAARHYWRDSVHRLGLALSRLTGVRLTAAGLRRAIARVGEATRVFRLLQELRQQEPAVISGSEVLLVNNVYFLGETESWTAATGTLLDELRERLAAGRAVGQRLAPRLLLTGSPPVFPNLKVPLLVEQAGGLIVADELCSSARLLQDAVVYAEEALYDMVPAVADRYLRASTCPCLTPNDNRHRRLLEMIRAARIDGVVYQAFSGCLPYELEQKAVAETMEKVGVPMLYVETDYSPEDAGQLTTRIEAFVESLKARRKRSAP